MKIATRSQVPPFAVMRIVAEANRRRALGVDVINLSVGEPSTGAAEVIRRAAVDALQGRRLGYTEAVGLPQLRAAIAGHYLDRYGVRVDPDRVAVTTGSSGGFLLAFLACFDVGDRVGVSLPGYPAYSNILRALGCEVVPLPCGPQTRYQPTVRMLAELDAPLDGLIVASPANPTGTMISPTELVGLAEWCALHGVRLISDEIYHGITYSEQVPLATAATLLDRGALVVNSFSKYWAMTGWRIGWLVLPGELVDPVDALAGNLALCPPAISQYAALAAFTPEAFRAAEENLTRYAASRRHVLGRLDELGWSRVAPADGAFYLYADISACGLDSVTWCERLLAEAGVALTPGTDFDPTAGSDWVRLSFACDVGTLAAALDRVVGWQRGLRG